MKEVTAFVCDFCPRKRRFAQRGTAVRHERKCFYNPATQACATCANFKFVRYDRETGEGGPECSKDMLNHSSEASTMLQHNCDGWEPKAVNS